MAGPPAIGPEISTNMEWCPVKPSLTYLRNLDTKAMNLHSFTHSVVAGGYFMWEISLPHLVLAALCGKFLLEKKKATATETERVCVVWCSVCDL